LTGPNRLLTASKRTRGLVPGTVRGATACRIELPPHQKFHHPLMAGVRQMINGEFSSGRLAGRGKRARVAKSDGVRNAQGAARSGSNDLFGSVAVSLRGTSGNWRRGSGP